MAHPSFSFLQFLKDAALGLLLASLLPFLLPVLAICSSFVLLFFFPLASAILFLAFLNRFSSALLSPLRPLLPPWLSDFTATPSRAVSFRHRAAACADRLAADRSLEPAESRERGRDGQGPKLPVQPRSAFDASDGYAFPRNHRHVLLDETVLLDCQKSTEQIPSPAPIPVLEVETSSDKQDQMEQRTIQDDVQDVLFHDSSEELSPFEPELSVSLAPVESASQEVSYIEDVEQQQLIGKRIDGSPGLRREELPELSAEEAYGECETPLLHPQWRGEGESHREVEGMIRVEVLQSDEHVSEFREECADVPQSIGLEPMEHIEEASCDAYDIARPACIQDAPEIFEEQAISCNTGVEDLCRGAEAAMAELGGKRSDDEMSRAICASSQALGAVSESRIESFGGVDEKNNTEAGRCSNSTAVVESTDDSTRDPPVMASSDKETKMFTDIDAIKKIVGYEADLHGCLAEQIQALYRFVGIEPSSSVVNNDDLEKAYEELELVKVIIGLE